LKEPKILLRTQRPEFGDNGGYGGIGWITQTDTTNSKLTKFICDAHREDGCTSSTNNRSWGGLFTFGADAEWPNGGVVSISAINDGGCIIRSGVELEDSRWLPTPCTVNVVINGGLGGRITLLANSGQSVPRLLAIGVPAATSAAGGKGQVLLFPLTRSSRPVQVLNGDELSFGDAVFAFEGQSNAESGLLICSKKTLSIHAWK
jgi:hypothetical protein